MELGLANTTLRPCSSWRHELMPHARASAHAGSERMEFDEPDFALIDTLFSLAEAHLFMQLVEMQVQWTVG